MKDRCTTNKNKHQTTLNCVDLSKAEMDHAHCGIVGIIDDHQDAVGAEITAFVWENRGVDWE